MKFKYIIISLLFASLIACKKGDSYDISKVTIFPTFEYETTVLLQVGETFTPSCIAKEGDKTLDITITGDVDINTAGIYEVVYSATNAEGYDGSANQEVTVYNPAITTDISGHYYSSIVRTESDGSDPRNYSAEVNITLVHPGIFYVDCLLGGTYSIAYGYGDINAMTGYISLLSDNTISYISSYVQDWGDSLTGFSNGVFNDVTGSLYWEAEYAQGDIFAVTLTN